MLTDSNRQGPLYSPGPYWAAKANAAANEIKRYGIADFRGSTNAFGVSYSDQPFQGDTQIQNLTLFLLVICQSIEIGGFTPNFGHCKAVLYLHLNGSITWFLTAFQGRIYTNQNNP